MLGNKICVTEKGLDLIGEGQNQYEVEEATMGTRKSSLPFLRTRDYSKKQTINDKLAKSQQLSKLASKLEAIEKIGLRKLVLRRQDRTLSRLLNEDLSTKQKYVKSIIPEIVKKTRDPANRANIDSRFTRSRAYTERLLQNYQSQKKFGVDNNIKRKNRQNQQQQNTKVSKI